MKRWIVILALGSLVWQQGSCCCCDDGTANCWKDLALAFLRWDASDPHTKDGCCAHVHSVVNEYDDNQVPVSQGPSRDHNHHICLGSHVFFLLDHNIPVLEISSENPFLLAIDEIGAKSIQILCAPSQQHLASRGLSTSTLPMRAVLQVFVI